MPPRKVAALAAAVLRGAVLPPQDERALRESVAREERNRPKASVPGGSRRQARMETKTK